MMSSGVSEWIEHTYASASEGGAECGIAVYISAQSTCITTAKGLSFFLGMCGMSR